MSWVHFFSHFQWWILEVIDFRAWSSLMPRKATNRTSFVLWPWWRNMDQIIWLPNNCSPILLSRNLASLVVGIWGGPLRQVPNTGVAQGLPSTDIIAASNDWTSILCQFRSLIASWSNRLQSEPSLNWSDCARRTRLVVFTATNW